MRWQPGRKKASRLYRLDEVRKRTGRAIRQGRHVRYPLARTGADAAAGARSAKSNAVFFLSGIGATILLCGWCNLGRSLAFGVSRVPFLELADEQLALLNIFQPILLIFLAFFCRACGRLETNNERRWSFSFLSIGFVILALGEIQSVGSFASFALTPSQADWVAQNDISSHMLNINRIHSFLGTENPNGVLAFLCVFPLGAGLALTGFLRSLPSRYSLSFLLCGTIYLTGVLGFEAVSQAFAIEFGAQSTLYLITSGAEETLETCGLLGFALALSGFMQERLN